MRTPFRAGAACAEVNDGTMCSSGVSVLNTCPIDPEITTRGLGGAARPDTELAHCANRHDKYVNEARFLPRACLPYVGRV